MNAEQTITKIKVPTVVWRKFRERAQQEKKSLPEYLKEILEKHENQIEPEVLMTKTMVNIPNDLWKKVKSSASTKGITLNQWIEEAVHDHLLMVEHVEVLEDISNGMKDIVKEKIKEVEK